MKLENHRIVQIILDKSKDKINLPYKNNDGENTSSTDLNPFYEMNGFMKVFIVINPLFYNISVYDFEKVKEILGESKGPLQSIISEDVDPMYFTLLQIEKILKDYMNKEDSFTKKLIS